MYRIITFVVGVVVVAGCHTAPNSSGDRASLESKARETLAEMVSKDPDLATLIANSAGYVVFPEIAKAGFGVGGSFGRGVLFRHGQRVGFVKLSQASVGAQIGGESLAELVVLKDDFALNRLRSDTFELGANATATAITVGASASVRFEDGIAVFDMVRGGAMAELSVAGQKLSYEAG
jgi:lipid-binding SYLF domain-containing protein